jgi:hypothetical protein
MLEHGSGIAVIVILQGWIDWLLKNCAIQHDVGE